MKVSGGKGKGSTFERQMCKDLSLWISAGKRDDLLWRSAMSGGRATVRHQKGKKTAHQAGDICAVHPQGHVLTDVFFIECKHVRDLQATALLLSDTGTIVKFWDKCVKESDKHNKTPMLIMRQNQYPIVVGLDAEGVSFLNVAADIQCKFTDRDLHIMPLHALLNNHDFPMPEPEDV